VTLSIHVNAVLAQQCRQNLEDNVRTVGFFLADFADPAFNLQAWRAMPDDAFEPSNLGHAVLKDDFAADVIKWAGDAGACLVEVHSHGLLFPVAFSSIDVEGFADWVPQVRWRLRGRPYAAMVTAADTVDAWAWCDDTGLPRQVVAMVIDGTTVVYTTGLTMERTRGRSID
jgi:hypothetical protein